MHNKPGFLLLPLLFLACSVWAQPVPADKFIEDMNKQDFERILEYYKQMPPLNKETAFSFVLVGLSQYQLGHYDKAKAVFKELVQMDPDNPKYITLLGISYKAAGETALAKEAFAKFVAILKKNAKNPEEAGQAWMMGKMIE